jgi:hypothetical protein
MNKQELTALVKAIARPMGYVNRSALFWKRGSELTRLVRLQSSRWGKGVYLNFGITPNRLIRNRVPPPDGYWGWEERGECLEGPYREVFARCANDKDDRMPAARMRKPVEWLIRWMESHLGDEQAVRASVRGEAAPLSVHTRPTGMLKDWADEKLQSAQTYFKGTPYYS